MDEEEEQEEEVGTKHKDAPMFGDAMATKEEVFAFYKYWESFTTIKQFAYVDPYDPRQAPNRRIKRLIENDNKKERQKERGRFNEKLHELVLHVKAKD
jgi:DnaJ family protein A protein 5